MNRIWLHNGKYGFDYSIYIDSYYNVTLSVLSEPSVRYQAEGYIDICWNSSTDGKLYFYGLHEVPSAHNNTEENKEIEPFELDITVEHGIFEYINDEKIYTSVRYKLSSNPIMLCYDGKEPNQNSKDKEPVYFHDCGQKIKRTKHINMTHMTVHNENKDHEQSRKQSHKQSQSDRELQENEWLNDCIWK